ncbi:hypothetical protein ACT4UT_29640 [Bacillus sp. B-TM1]
MYADVFGAEAGLVHPHVYVLL